MSSVFNIEKIMGFCSIICQSLGLNLLFLFSNLPLVWFFFSVGLTQAETYLFLFCLCLIPLGPSLCALFYTMHKLMRDGDIKLFASYKKGYRNNVKQGIILASMEALFLFIIQVNHKAFTQVYPSFFLSFLFGILFILLILLTPNLYLLAMHYEMKIIDIIKSALAITIGKPIFTLGNLAAFFFGLVAYDIAPGIAILFVGSVYAFFVLFMNKRLFDLLEK